MTDIIVKTCAAQLPREWDELAGDNIYLKRNFLSFMESVDSCDQKYYMLTGEDGGLDTIFMTYRRSKYNLFMFTKLNFPANVTFVYVPLSVTRPGLATKGSRLSDALRYIKTIKGCKVMLNMPAMAAGKEHGYAVGLTCPKCILTLRWNSFDEYLKSMRSSYRYRYNKAQKKGKGLSARFISGEEFTPELYSFYESVYEKSSVKIEKLSYEFFRGDFFKIFALYDEQNKPHGFVQLLENGSELFFEFVGINYETNSMYDTYLNMLLEIVRYGIDNGFKTIDFGQTADDTKLKLGSRYTYLYAYVHYHNPLMQALCKRLAKRIQYKPITTDFNVFKEA